jgi:hypothetical protein
MANWVNLARNSTAWADHKCGGHHGTRHVIRKWVRLS